MKQTLSVCWCVDGNGQFFYVLDAKTNNISQFKINADGTLSPLNPPSVPDGGGVYTIKTAKTVSGSFLYVTVPESNKILQYKINANGTLTPLSPSFTTSTGDQPAGIAVHPNAPNAYESDRWLARVGCSQGC